jgi:2-(1,2-epoxy-1,2-dihydrophenyl)acetyl-CoA isomerase
VALVATRRLINAAEGASLKEQLAAEAASQKALGDSGDYRAAVSAFLAKQKPSFNGR